LTTTRHCRNLKVWVLVQDAEMATAR